MTPYQQQSAALKCALEALETTAGNIRSLKGSMPGVTTWDEWLDVTETAAASLRSSFAELR